MSKLTDAQKRLLSGLKENGGVFDRYVRIVGGGEVLTRHGSTTALTCFRDNLIIMNGKRVVLTIDGRIALENCE